MKTIFDQSTRDEIIERISILNKATNAHWGKMNVYQMVRHGRLWDDMMQSNKPVRRNLIGRIFGPLVLKKLLKDDKPLRHNTPTIPSLVIKDAEGNLEHEKQIWIDRIKRYADFSNENVLHPFFGKISREQLGRLVYKHTDHHLRQFSS